MRNYPCIYTFQTISNMEKEDRIVMTLDAGGTNLVFSALQNGREIVEPIRFPSVTDDLEACLATLRRGFEAVKQQVGNPVAISFAFPGPADYRAGIIGDLPNFPAFRGGVALGPFLEEAFGIPVFINNDGNLFAYGEAMAGILPEINQKLEQMGNPRRYRNLLGVTLGTGFGGGMVANGELVLGDNQMAGYLWCQRHRGGSCRRRMYHLARRFGRHRRRIVGCGEVHPAFLHAGVAYQADVLRLTGFPVANDSLLSGECRRNAGFSGTPTALRPRAGHRQDGRIHDGLLHGGCSLPLGSEPGDKLRGVFLCAAKFGSEEGNWYTGIVLKKVKVVFSSVLIFYFDT